MMIETTENKNEILSVPNVLTYQFFEENRYTISQYQGYESLCNNGFIKLYTINTRVYWHTQNQFEHRTPDWKFHVSVHQSDLKKAWNLLVGLFIKLKCRAGMKTSYIRQNIGIQPGRQITIYIVKIDSSYENSSFAGDFNLSIADQHSDDFWMQFVQKAETLLQEHNITPNGLANGDLKIGKYLSLRNQSFVLDANNNYIYPPNDVGWNPNNQQLPFSHKKFAKIIRPEQNQLNHRRPLYYFMLPVFAVSAGLMIMHRHYNTSGLRQ